MIFYLPISSLAFCFCLFLFPCSRVHRDLHSFPTRRSSDLYRRVGTLPAPLQDFYRSSTGTSTDTSTGFGAERRPERLVHREDRKSTRLNSSHGYISYAVFCLKKKKKIIQKTKNKVHKIYSP